MRLFDKLDDLNQKYEVLCCIDLNHWFEVELLNRRNWLATMIQRHRKDCFETNQRLVFTLTKEANCGNTATNNVLVFLQRLLNEIDISSYFVTVVTANPVDTVYLQAQNNETVPITIESISNEL